MANEVAVVATRLPMPNDVEDMDARKWKVLVESVFPSAKTTEAVVMALDYCRARKLDPFKRPVNIVPMWNKTIGKEVETVWPGINEVQTTAARTGQYAGMDKPEWGPEIGKSFEGEVNYKDEKGVWKKEKLKVEVAFPEWCSVTVYRMIQGQRCAFTEPVYWLEGYGRRGKTDVPNDMWAKRPRGQLLKVAKAFSLRAAFPEEGEYVAEEMEGKEIAAGGVVIENEAPKVKSVFQTAKARNDWTANACDSLDTATKVSEIDTILKLNEEKLLQMDAAVEHDQLAAEEVRKRAELARSRLAPADPRNPKMLDPVDEYDKRFVGVQY